MATPPLPAPGEEVFCICRKPDSGELMVGCDGCDDWFHFACLAIPEKYHELVFSFYCPRCQAGETGPAAEGGDERARALPRTMWRRKCRVGDCFKPVAATSQYCGEDHARAYWRALVERTDEPARDHLRHMLQEPDVAHFQRLGQGPPRSPPPGSEAVLAGDGLLQELAAQLHGLRTRDRPLLDAHSTRLAAYGEWVRAANQHLFSGGDGGDDRGDKTASARARPKRKRPAKPQALCGYRADLEPPCAPERFAVEFQAAPADEVRGVCARLRCARHLDWAGIQHSALQFQRETLDSSEHRLALLLELRRDQLRLQLYKKLGQDARADTQPVH
ncbi:LADA_0C07448g1_1 [Lachancea dasiensis]|uniref:LADA_0C07448g1_1 n=1 Tax=Lachancea dasiensis TaxID=1072105 RepID=A0A1G4IZZ2_9SACH|nr:LADA_0C07448g1_1 [Lachancea dasiensis]